MSRREPVHIGEIEYVDEIQVEHLDEDRLGLVVFGPGHGEAIVVRFPDDTYGVVDGCSGSRHDLDSSFPVHQFLQRAAASDMRRPLRIRFVCLTHPHSDHFRGLPALLRDYRDVIDEVWSPPETGTRWADAYARWCNWRTDAAELPDERPSELFELFKELQRPEREIRDLEMSKWLFQESLLETRFDIMGLAPTDRDSREARMALWRAQQAMNDGNVSASEFDPNRSSGALLLSWAGARVLLAGDVLTGGSNVQRGWNRALKHVPGRVQVVNVAHHASLGAHHPELWDSMSPGLAIVTPFQHAAGKQPPRPGDIERLLDSGARVVVTSRPAWVGRDSDPRPVQDWTPPPMRSKNPAMAMTHSVRQSDKRNAVAVSLDRRGAIRRVVLAGQADFYTRANAGTCQH